jgi:HdeA/HdeB family
LLLLSQAQEPKEERKVIHLAEMTCKMFTELTKQKQGIIMAWLQGYELPEGEPALIDVDKLLSDRAKLTEYCIDKPQDDVMTAAEAVMEKYPRIPNSPDISLPKAAFPCVLTNWGSFV